MKKLLLLLSSCTALSGCLEYKSPQDRCYEYGYAGGTDAFRDCVADETRADRIIEENRRSQPLILNTYKYKELPRPSIIGNSLCSSCYD